MIKALQEKIGSDAKCLDFMVALGTHQPLSEEVLTIVPALELCIALDPPSPLRLDNRLEFAPGKCQGARRLRAGCDATTTGGSAVSWTTSQTCRRLFQSSQPLSCDVRYSLRRIKLPW